jgi:hypothetical protein
MNVMLLVLFYKQAHVDNIESSSLSLVTMKRSMSVYQTIATMNKQILIKIMFCTQFTLYSEI